MPILSDLVEQADIIRDSLFHKLCASTLNYAQKYNGSIFNSQSKLCLDPINKSRAAQVERGKEGMKGKFQGGEEWGSD